jgi:Flp pilus assembly protein TadG
MISLKRLRKSESGQIAVLSAIFISLFLIGFAALVVDVGFLYATRRNMQTVADAAAIAGANALNSGLECDAGSCASAQDLASLNGYTNGTNGVSVTAKPPAVKPNPADGTYVEVDVSQPVPTYFLRAIGYNTVTVGAKAVAGFAPTSNCIIVTDPNNDSKTLTVSGGSNINANCGVLDESTNGDGMDVSGGSTVAGSTVGVVASSYTGGSASSITCNGSNADCPAVKVAPSADPLLYLQSAEPTPGTCMSTVNSTMNAIATAGNGGTIGPGTYCAGIKAAKKGALNALNLNPGLYILTGSTGLQISGGATINGTGVTIYNTGTGSINISGGSIANLSAPATGSTLGIPGILFFQDPANTAKATLSGGSAGTFTGALYFPSTQMLTFSGGSSATPNNVVLDAFKITISGGSAYLGTPVVAGGGPPITTTRLYE